MKLNPVFGFPKLITVASSLSPKPSCAGPCAQVSSLKAGPRQAVPWSVPSSRYLHTECVAIKVMFVGGGGGALVSLSKMRTMAEDGSPTLYGTDPGFVGGLRTLNTTVSVGSTSASSIGVRIRCAFEEPAGMTMMLLVNT